MKQKTQTLKRIFIFTLLTFLLACEKDDAHSHESEINQNAKFKVNRINEEKLKKNAPKIFSRIEGINNKKVNGDNNPLNRLVNINNDFLIETDEVLEVIEADRTTYTFPITRMVETDFTENLVLVIKDNGVIYGKIVKYDLSEQDKANIKSNIKVNLSNKISTTDIDNINAISAQLLRVNSDCVDYIQIGGPNCPGSLHHTLEQMASGQCPLVNSGNYVPSPEYIVQIIVDMDCDDSNNSGGVIIDESEPTYPGGNYPGGTGNTQPPTNGDTGSTNPPNDPNNNDPNPNQSIDDNPLATYPMIPNDNRIVTKLLNNLDNDQKNWWNNIANEDIKIEILDYLLANNSNDESTQEVKDIIDTLIENNTSAESLQLASLTLQILSNNEPWTPDVGNYNNIPSLHYTHKRTTYVKGKQFYQYLLSNGDVLGVMDYGTGQDVYMRTLYYSREIKDWFFIPKPTPNFNYVHTDLDFIFNGFWSTVQTGVRYCTPLEDMIILIDGKDFDGVASSRAVAGIFILVDAAGGKALKITKKLGHTLSAASTPIKVIIDITTKTQKALKKQYKNVISTASNGRKGVFGEICTDIDFVEKGYEVIHVNRKTTIDPIGDNTGIDHIFKNPQTGEFIIVETKYHGTGGLSTLVDGTRQMSDNWISNGLKNSDDRLWNAVGGNLSLYNQMKPSLTTTNYTRVISYVQPDGTINYKYITSQGYEINTHSGVFTN